MDPKEFGKGFSCKDYREPLVSILAFGGKRDKSATRDTIFQPTLPLTHPLKKNVLLQSVLFLYNTEQKRGSIPMSENKFHA